MPAFTYILKLRNGKFYCGWTNDLEKRLAAHNSGKGSKCTRTQLPAELVWYYEAADKSEAMSLEWHIKRLSKADKQKLTDGVLSLNDIFPDIPNKEAKDEKAE